MTTKQEISLQKFEQYMRENAIAINYNSVKMQEISNVSAHKALKGIIEYLQDTLDDME